jgi:hypothetical protein
MDASYSRCAVNEPVQSTSHFLVGKSTFLDFYIENNPLTLNYYKKSLILKL